MRIIGLVAAAALVITTAAPDVVRAQAIDATDIWAMDAAALRNVGEFDLCEAYARQRQGNLDMPAVDAEIRRRNANCTASIRSFLGACAGLRLVKTEPVPGRGTAFYVRNTSNETIGFHINYRGVASSKFEIGPQTESGFGVAVDVLTAAAGKYVNRDDLRSRRVEFYDCSTLLGGYSPGPPVMVPLDTKHRTPGYYPVDNIRDMFGSARVAKPKIWRARLTQGVAYRIVATCGQGCTDINLDVLDPAGASVGADTEPNNAPAVAFVAPATGVYSVQLSVVQCAHRYCEFAARVLSRR